MHDLFNHLETELLKEKGLNKTFACEQNSKLSLNDFGVTKINRIKIITKNQLNLTISICLATDHFFCCYFICIHLVHLFVLSSYTHYFQSNFF